MTKGAPVLVLLSNLSYEKNISLDILLSLLEDTIAQVAQPSLSVPLKYLEVKINKAIGSVLVYRKWHILPECDKIAHPEYQIHLRAAKRRFCSDEIKIGIYHETLDYKLSRVDINHIKFLIQKALNLRESRTFLEDMKNMPIPMIKGEVTHILPTKILLKIKHYDIESFIYKRFLLKHDRCQLGDILECHVETYSTNSAGKLVLKLTRCSEDMISALLWQNIPEVADKEIYIHKIARLSSVRSKIAVAGKKGVDPVGAVIGFKGRRVKTISKLLGGEQLDVILYSPNLKEFISNAFGDIRTDDISEERDGTITVYAQKSMLPSLIGARGSNVNLVSQLVGRTIRLIRLNS